MSNSINPWIEICAGIKRRTLSHGTRMYQMVAQLDADCVMSEHQHTQEQIVYVVSGSIRLIVSGIPRPMAKGDSFYLASKVPHGVETLEQTTIVDTFSPTREDYLAIDSKIAGDVGRPCLTNVATVNLAWSCVDTGATKEPSDTILSHG